MDVSQKVQSVLKDALPCDVQVLDASVRASKVEKRIAGAVSEEFGKDVADKISINMSCWKADAAFVIALHLCPQKFTDKEIREGLGEFLLHAPNHIATLCKLTDTFVQAFTD